MLRKLVIATAALALSAPVFAACDVTIEGNDQMKFNMTNIDVSKSCKEFTVTLKHVGKMPKTAMGHNWVLSKTADMKPIADEGAKLKDKDYIKADDTRIIAHTKLIGGGESDKITFPISKLSATDSYSFYCTFPGHAALMKGTLKLVN